MKVALLITVALILFFTFLRPIQAKKKPKKFCVGKDGNRYEVGKGYVDNEGKVCVQYKCVKKKNKLVMKKGKCVSLTVDGVWSDWSGWSACSSTCGAATKKRKRTCSSPPPSDDGSPCPGLKEQIEECCLPSCCPGENVNVTALELNVQSLNDSVQVLQSTVQSILELITAMQSTANKKVYFLAGGNGAERDISLYHPTTDNVACSISPPTLNNYWEQHTTFYYNSTIHICGGFGTQSTCISHNTDTEGWKTHTLTTERWIGHSSVVLHNRLYLIGGLYGNTYLGAECTPLPLTDTPVLTPVPNLEYKGYYPCTAKIDQDTLVVTVGYGNGENGGESGYVGISTYNVKTSTYTQLPSLKQGRYSHGCGVVEKGNTKWIIVAGGVNEAGTTLGSTEMLQLGGSDWTTIGNLNVARHGASMVVTPRGVMIMGGEGDSSSVELLDWDSADKTWSVVEPSLNKPRSYFGGAVEIPASMFGCTG